MVWIPPGVVLIRFLYTVKRMSPEVNLQEYRMLSAFAALGPPISSDLRASISCWLLLNAVSLVSLTRYTQACSPWVPQESVASGCPDCRGHRPQLCYLSSPSQDVDSSLFRQLLGPSFWMVLVVLGVIAKRKAWLRDRLQYIVDTSV